MLQFNSQYQNLFPEIFKITQDAILSQNFIDANPLFQPYTNIDLIESLAKVYNDIWDQNENAFESDDDEEGQADLFDNWKYSHDILNLLRHCTPNYEENPYLIPAE